MFIYLVSIIIHNIYFSKLYKFNRFDYTSHNSSVDIKNETISIVFVLINQGIHVYNSYNIAGN